MVSKISHLIRQNSQVTPNILINFLHFSKLQTLSILEKLSKRESISSSFSSKTFFLGAFGFDWSASFLFKFKKVL